MADNPVNRNSQPDFKLQVEFDDQKRELEETKMALKEVQAENHSLTSKLQLRNQEMEQVYKQLQDQKVTQQKFAAPLPTGGSNIDLELAQTRFELTLEKKLTEIVHLKSELQQSKNELMAAQRQAEFAQNNKVYQTLAQTP